MPRLRNALALLILCYALPAQVPNVGGVVSFRVVDATTVFSWHTAGWSVTFWDANTGQVHTSYASIVADGGANAIFTGPGQFVLEYPSEYGVMRVVTPWPSTNPSALQLSQTAERHKRAILVMQNIIPPVPGGAGVIILPA